MEGFEEKEVKYSVDSGISTTVLACPVCEQLYFTLSGVKGCMNKHYSEYVREECYIDSVNDAVKEGENVNITNI